MHERTGPICKKTKTSRCTRDALGQFLKKKKKKKKRKNMEKFNLHSMPILDAYHNLPHYIHLRELPRGRGVILWA